ncbi:exonuclease domain-containing protein [Sulfurimonas sp. HSL-1716]|uniref:exonuclease domain-containing protein n=1 Tax=Hydrocurvibacter sulfurireducens TaxID=3131937 RepID=UPI0031F7DC40
MAKYIILDTETTGAGESDRIIQLGYMVLGNGDIEVQNEFCSTDVPISFGAMEVHHITPEMIADKPVCKDTQAYKRLLELNTEENYVIIHNAPFDIGMLEKEGFSLKMKLIDTLRCAKHIFEDEEAHRLQFFRYKMGLYKQEEAEAKKLGIEVKAHDAIGDVLTLKLFLTELKKSIEERFAGENPVEKMVYLTQEPIFIKTFRFGKYKGKSLADVAAEDAGYLRWMLKSMDNIDVDLKYSIEKVLSL